MAGRPSSAFVCTLYAACILGLASLTKAQTQNQTQPITHPSEVGLCSESLEFHVCEVEYKGKHRAVVLPCTDLTSVTYRDHHNPIIKCDCTYNDSTICHFTQLKVYENVAAPIPEELYGLNIVIDL